MSDIKFSVIVPSYKMGRYIGSALLSVASQTMDSWEVIVVDDCGPEDGSSEIVAAFASANPGHRVEFIRHEQNTGVSGARNTAISAAKGEFLAFLDPDDLWFPSYLQRVASILENAPTTAVVSSPPEAFRDTPSGEIIERTRFQQWQIEQFPSSLAAGNFIQPSSTVVRRSAITEIGGFDISPDIQHIEDYDLWIRLVAVGAEFLFLNETLSRYRKHDAAATSNTRRMTVLHENLAGKHSPFFLHAQSNLLRELLVRQERMRFMLKSPFKALFSRWVR